MKKFIILNRELVNLLPLRFKGQSHEILMLFYVFLVQQFLPPPHHIHVLLKKRFHFKFLNFWRNALCSFPNITSWLLHFPRHIFLAHLILKMCVFFRPTTTVAVVSITVPRIYTPRCFCAAGW
jgi:hypothetical protein